MLDDRLLALEKPVVQQTFGNPCAAQVFLDADSIIVDYDQSPHTIYAATGGELAPHNPMGVPTMCRPVYLKKSSRAVNTAVMAPMMPSATVSSLSLRSAIDSDVRFPAVATS